MKAGAGLAAIPRDPHPRRGLDAGRRGLPVHRRPGRQRAGRGLLQRRPQQQDLQDRPRRQGQPVRSPTRSRPTARRSGPTAGSTPLPPVPARSSPMTPPARPRVIAEGIPRQRPGRPPRRRHLRDEPRRRRRARARSGTSARRARSESSTTGLKFANGITLSPDQSLLYVADFASHWVYSYQVQPDGSLAHKQKYFHLHVPDTRRRHRRRRHARRPRRPALRGHAHGHPGLRPGRPGQLHHPHAQRQGRQPLLRRPGFRHALRHLRRPRLQAEGQGQRRECLPGARSSPRHPGCDFTSGRQNHMHATRLLYRPLLDAEPRAARS